MRSRKMSTKRRTGYAVLSALGFAALLATLALAQPDHMGGGRGMGGGFAGSPGMGSGFSGGPGTGNDQMGGLVRLLSALDLTDEQRTEIRTITEDARDDMLAVRESVQGSNPREELMALFVREDISLAEVKDVFDDMDRIQEEVRDIMLEAFVDIHDVLTSDQLAELARLIEEHSGMHHGPDMPRFH